VNEAVNQRRMKESAAFFAAFFTDLRDLQ